MSLKSTIRRLDLLSPNERQRILSEWNDTRRPIPNKVLSSLFQENVERHPDATAVVFGDAVFTYHALNQSANRLATVLIERDIGPEDIVAVIVPRSIEMIVALLAITKAGAAYLPLEQRDPSRRLGDILQEARPAMLLATSESANHVSYACPQILLDDILIQDHCFAQGLECLDPTPRMRPDPGNSLYIMYTSGSTGMPKGVVVAHRSVVRLVCNPNYVRLGPQEVILQLAPTSFDASTFEIWGALLNGGKLILFPAVAPTLNDLRRVVQQMDITTLWLTAALFHEVVQSDVSSLDGLQQLLAGGDALAIADVKRVLEELPGCRLINGYGPTEATTFSCCHTFERQDLLEATVPIGRPISNTEVYVLDDSLQVVPVGMPGDLYVSGPGVARGYFRRPAMTAEKFAANPYGEPGTRMYRTGDRACWRANGSLEFLGRLDRQVKVRGFRVELDEIEAVLRSTPGVDAAATIIQSDAGDERIVSYVTASKGSNLDGLLLREALAERLPNYMLPAAVIVIPDLPLTESGKVDRRALPAADFRRKGNTGSKPESVAEEVLCGLFAQVLQVNDPGVDDNFFELGGHSLTAVSLVSRIHAVFKADVDIAEIFEAPTVRQLAKRLQRKTDRIPLGPQTRPPSLPLSYAQQRLWFLYELSGGSTEYNVTGALRLKGDLDVTALERAVNTIVERHETLRTHFDNVGGTPLQVIEPRLRITITVEDLRSLIDSDKEARLQSALRHEWAQPFDLRTGPLFRMKLLRLEDREHVMLRTMHHIVSDGWSQGIFTRELMVLYEAYADGRENPLKPLPVQYADFVLWQRESLKGDVLTRQLTYWRQQLAGIPEQVSLPTDRPRPSEQTFEAEWCEVVVPAPLTTSVRQLTRAANGTLFMTLLAVFGTLLERYSRQQDIVVGSPIANRQDEVLEDLIGVFVNTHVIRMSVDPQMTFRELLAQIHQTTLDAYKYQDLPFERLVEELAPRRSPGVMPLFQIVFALQNAPWKPQQLKGLEITPIRGDKIKVRTDLEVHVLERDAELVMLWVFATDLFDRWRMEQMALHYVRMLEAFISNPDQAVGRVNIVLGAERRQILEQLSENSFTF